MFHRYCLLAQTLTSTLLQDPGTSDDSGRASERLTGSSVAPRDPDSSRDRLSDVSVLPPLYMPLSPFRLFTRPSNDCVDLVLDLVINMMYSTEKSIPSKKKFNGMMDDDGSAMR